MKDLIKKFSTFLIYFRTTNNFLIILSSRFFLETQACKEILFYIFLFYFSLPSQLCCENCNNNLYVEQAGFPQKIHSFRNSEFQNVAKCSVW